MEQPSHLSGEALDLAIENIMRAGRELSALRREMGRLAYETYPAAKRQDMFRTAETLARVAEDLVRDAKQYPEQVPPPPRETWYDALLASAYWLPNVGFCAEEPPREIFVVDNAVLMVGEQHIRLQREEVFLVNCLLVERQPLTSRIVALRIRNEFGEPITLADARRMLVRLQAKIGESSIRCVNAGPAGHKYRFRNGLFVTDVREQALPKDDLELPEGVIEVEGDFFAEPPKAIQTDTRLENVEPTPRVDEGKWGDATDIARLVEMDIRIVERFIDRNRDALSRGGKFRPPEPRRRPGQGIRVTEHYSPQFVAWAVASLQAARQRYLDHMDRQR